MSSHFSSSNFGSFPPPEVNIALFCLEASLIDKKSNRELSRDSLYYLGERAIITVGRKKTSHIHICHKEFHRKYCTFKVQKKKISVVVGAGESGVYVNGSFLTSSKGIKCQKSIDECDIVMIKGTVKRLVIFRFMKSTSGPIGILSQLSTYYQIFRRIGEGDCTTVYLAQNFVNHLAVAIKVIQRWKSSIFNDEEINEIKILRSLKHPHVVELLSVKKADTEIAIIMECMELGNLFDYVSTRTEPLLNEGDLRRLFSQIVDAVSYLHSNGIIHGNLKPENIGITSTQRKNSSIVFQESSGLYESPVWNQPVSEMHLKLLDFGLSSYIDDEEKAGPQLNPLMGGEDARKKPRLSRFFDAANIYISPEIQKQLEFNFYSETIQLTPKCDIWSLGVLLFFLLCKKIPSALIDGESTLQDIPNLSEDFQDLLKMMLDCDPDKRCSIEDVKTHRWMLNRTSEELHAE